MGKVTLKIVQKYEVNAEGKYVVRLRVTADRKSRFVASPVEVTQTQFNPKGKRELKNWIRANHPNAEVYNNILKELWDTAVDAVDSTGPGATADQVKSLIEQKQSATNQPLTEQPDAEVKPSLGFIAYCNFYIKRRGEGATTDTYADAKKAFARFLDHLVKTDKLPTAEILFEDLTIAFLKSWRSWVLEQYKNNTAWMYHSRLKSMYFQAVEDHQDLAKIPTVTTDPFRRVKITKVKTKKQRLYEDEIERIAAVELKWGMRLREIRDMHLVMYYAQGMRIGDALRLRVNHYVIIDTIRMVDDKPERVVEHRLIYPMKKGKKTKNALLPQQAIDLLAPYLAEAPSPDSTIFKMLRKEINAGFSPEVMRKKVKAKVGNIKSRLGDLMEKAGIDKTISSHVFRHSFADLARRNNMDWLEIQKAMGHERFSTTEEYLEDLDENSADNSVSLFKLGQQQDNNNEKKQA